MPNTKESKLGDVIYDIMLNWKDFCCKRHDIDCNQKYASIHPYSFHLRNVVGEIKRFAHLLDDTQKDIAIAGGWGHDLIEDARMTYDEVRQKLGSFQHADQIAEVIYCCTDEKGRSRRERKPNRYYNELQSNHTALLVKLCDVISNVKYSILTNSSMITVYSSEYYSHLIYLSSPPNFTEMYDYLGNLFSLR